MNNNPDTTWNNLLKTSAPTFSGDANPPYGFVTSTLAMMGAARRQQLEFERIGWRAFMASLGALAVAVALTLVVSLHDSTSEFDPGVRSLVQMDSLPYS